MPQVSFQFDPIELANVVRVAFLGADRVEDPRAYDDEDLEIAKTILESPWFAKVIQSVSEGTIAQHAQAIMDAQREAIAEQLVAAEMRGYERKLSDTLQAAVASLQETGQTVANELWRAAGLID